MLSAFCRRSDFLLGSKNKNILEGAVEYSILSRAKSSTITVSAQYHCDIAYYSLFQYQVEFERIA